MTHVAEFESGSDRNDVEMMSQSTFVNPLCFSRGVVLKDKPLM